MRGKQEKMWPEFNESEELSRGPAEYLGTKDDDVAGNASKCEEGAKWCSKYLGVRVQTVQEHRQHHVHLPDAATGERKPLTHCR